MLGKMFLKVTKDSDSFSHTTTKAECPLSNILRTRCVSDPDFFSNFRIPAYMP